MSVGSIQCAFTHARQDRPLLPLRPVRERSAKQSLGSLCQGQSHKSPAALATLQALPRPAGIEVGLPSSGSTLVPSPGTALAAQLRQGPPGRWRA